MQTVWEVLYLGVLYCYEKAPQKRQDPSSHRMQLTLCHLLLLFPLLVTTRTSATPLPTACSCSLWPHPTHTLAAAGSTVPRPPASWTRITLTLTHTELRRDTTIWIQTFILPINESESVHCQRVSISSVAGFSVTHLQWWPCMGHHVNLFVWK